MSEFLDYHFQQGKTVYVNGVKTFLIDKGEGDVILLLHGFFATSYTFRKLIPHLAKNFRVIAPDLPGIGFSDTPHEVYSHRMLAKFVHSLLTEITDKPVHFVVHDYGGPIAFLLLNEFPEKVKTLTVMSSFLNLRKFRFYFPLYLLNKRWLGNLFSKMLSPVMLKLIYNSKFLVPESKIDDEIAKDYFQLLFAGEKRINFTKMCQFVDRTIYAQKDMEEGLKKMIGGRQILTGEVSPLLNPYEAEYIKQKMRLSYGNFIPGKHFLMEESPELCAEKISILVSKFSQKSE
ncbi:MAG: alpha/beta hydrolase [Spirochaetota bacterium]